MSQCFVFAGLFETVSVIKINSRCSSACLWCSLFFYSNYLGQTKKSFGRLWLECK